MPTTPPIVTSWSLSANGAVISINCSGGVFPSSGITSFTFSGTESAISGLSAAGSNIIGTVSPPAGGNQDIKLNYTAGNVHDVDLNYMLSFAGMSGTNKSAVQSTTTCALMVYGPNGAGLSGKTVDYRLVDVPTITASVGYDRSTRTSSASDSAGLISLTFIRGAEYQIRLSGGPWTSFIAAQATTTAISPLVSSETV